METIAISHHDKTAALAAPDRYWLAAHIEALPDGHPTKSVVALMALYAGDVLSGALNGPYSDERALAFARLALLDADPCITDEQRNDAQLAAALNIPLCEIAAVRRDHTTRRRRTGRPLAGGRRLVWRRRARR